MSLTPRALPRNVMALAAVSLLTDASSEMIYPLLPVFIAGTLGAGAMSLGLIEGFAQAVAAVMQVVSGAWSDRLGKRKALVVTGYGIAGALRPLIGIATSVSQVLAIRIGDRIGKGIRGAPRDALIADSVPAEVRGRAFGFHRAADHAGAVVGPLVAFALLAWVGLEIRTVFLLAAIPGLAALLVALFAVRDVVPREGGGKSRIGLPGARPRGRFAAYLWVLVIFTLGNSTDAFLLLRAQDAGVPAAQLPLLWAALHVVKSASSTWGGGLSDRFGRRPVLVAGWVVYALVYVAFAFVSTPVHVWTTMTLYGAYFGLTEGVEKAVVADLVPREARGASFGWFNLALGSAALPASVGFGMLWERWGAPTAFLAGAGAALLATLLIIPVLAGQRSDPE